MILKAILKGILGTASLLSLYFIVLTLVSGWDFALSQFLSFWYFIVGLASGFGVQVGLYSYLKNTAARKDPPKKSIVVSGTTSTVAMISCCSHYLASILPIIAVSGFISFAAQYQVQLFWLGLIFNIGGISYIATRMIKFRKK